MLEEQEVGALTYPLKLDWLGQVAQRWPELTGSAARMADGVADGAWWMADGGWRGEWRVAWRMALRAPWTLQTQGSNRALSRPQHTGQPSGNLDAEDKSDKSG